MCDFLANFEVIRISMYVGLMFQALALNSIQRSPLTLLSVGEWEIYLTESSSFIFYGLERLLSYIPPHKMPALNIPDCNCLFSFDLAETSKSFQRQSKLDVLKT